MQNQSKSARLIELRSSLRSYAILRDTIISVRNLNVRRQRSVKASINATTEILMKKKVFRMACRASFPPVISNNMPEYVKGVAEHLLYCTTEPTPCVAEHHNLYEC